jgi:porin
MTDFPSSPVAAVRDMTASRGLEFHGRYSGAFFGVAESEQGRRGFWSQQIYFGANLDPTALATTGNSGRFRLKSMFRYREPGPVADPNSFVEANTMFNPSPMGSGKQFRVMSLVAEFSSGDLLPVEDMAVLRAGWIQPQREFLRQPLTSFFLNNAINSSKGVGGNIPFSSSFSTWGGTLALRPTQRSFLKGGLFMVFPRATSTGNHGLAFRGYGPDPSSNSLMFLTEGGVETRLGNDELPGRYAFGTWFSGLDRTSNNGTPTTGQYGFYFQVEQMLFKESGGGPKEGLETFHVATFAPGNNNTFPFYFHSGLGWRGAVPGRPDDTALAAFGLGAYGNGPAVPERTYTAVLEAGYVVKVATWADIQPYAQYLVRPDGTDEVRNAVVAGVSVRITF